jgi:hypothetical protein
MLLATLATLLAGAMAPIGPLFAQSRDSADPVAMAIANADRLTARRTNADCRRQAAAAIARGDPDIIVCAPEQDQYLPVPEVYGPVYGSTDGRAVDPTEPCGLSLQTSCYEGFNLLGAIPATITIVSRLLDPDQDLGTPTPIPDRFRGANR